MQAASEGCQDSSLPIVVHGTRADRPPIPGNSRNTVKMLLAVWESDPDARCDPRRPRRREPVAMGKNDLMKDLNNVAVS